MTTPPPNLVTRLLLDWSAGDKEAFDQLVPLVHEELRRLAEGYMRREPAGHTLQPTALVNEAYLRLVDQRRMRWQDRAHFFAISAQMMRRILVDHARKRRYAERGGPDAIKMNLDEALDFSQGRAAHVVALDNALSQLAKVDPQHGKVVELRFFGGLTIEETADVLGLSRDRVKREWATAKEWLTRELTAQTAEGSEPVSAQKTGPYEILEQLGAGGMGEVFLAHDSRLGRKVALKLLPSYFINDGERLQRFQQEASAASRLNHPNIVTIYEVGQLDSGPYIATEYIDGVTLRAWMEQKHLSVSDAIDAALQVASALAAAHAAGIVHRDIKPENIMVRRDGLFKVVDFGLAKLTEPGVAPISPDLAATKRLLFKTDPGTVMGTVIYMSPEQARGWVVDARTDIWSLGVVLYEMVAGQPPFDGGSVADILVSILDRGAPPLTHPGGVPPELARVVAKALHKDQEQRYAQVDDLMRDLRVLQQDLSFAEQLRRSTQGESIAPETPAIETAAPEASGRRAHNFSTQRSTLIGRDTELALLNTRLRDDEVRLVTLTGPGGTGKTRLALQAAGDVVDAFDHGVVFVALAAISNHEVVASAIAQALGVQETRERTFAAGLINYLRDKTMLLVLDNFEQVAPASLLVADLLASCPQVKVLVTSRAPLQLSDEREFQVPPLALRQAEVLFVQRVMAAKPQFALTTDSARVISEICARLDGLPLALELAATRIKLLSLEEISARLNQPLQLLQGGAKDLPPRQQTMRATIAWSYDLLSDDAQMLWRRLSVFVGGFTLASAEAVCSDINGVTIAVLDALESLVDESLVQRKDIGDGTYRFLMLETIREYGLERLAASGETAQLRRQHAMFCVDLAEDAERHLRSVRRDPWLARLESEHHNIGAALRWTLDNDETEMGLRLVGALRWFWYHRGHIGEGYHWATALLARQDATASVKARANALYAAGSLAFYYSDPTAAGALLRESAVLWRALGDRQSLAYALTFTSLPIHLGERDFPEARTTAEEAVALFRTLDDPWGLALSLNYAGIILWTEPGAEQQATAMLKESVSLFRGLGDGWGVGGAALYLGGMHQDRGEVQEARALYEEFVAVIRESKDLWRLASGLEILASLLRDEGEDARADALTEESTTLQRKLGRSLSLKKAWDQMKLARQRS
ncbi:MAG TPA: ECF-type sigma factor [Vicinamibacterales bacterium]|nr:ECF-type sigma factor [Vicinamibacterales bacterium]